MNMQELSMEGGVGQDDPALAEEFWASDGYWGMICSFLQGCDNE